MILSGLKGLIKEAPGVLEKVGKIRTPIGSLKNLGSTIGIGGALGIGSGIAMSAIADKSYLQGGIVGGLAGAIGVGVFGNRNIAAKTMNFYKRDSKEVAGAIGQSVRAFSSNTRYRNLTGIGLGAGSAFMFGGQRSTFYDRKSKGLNSARGYKLKW